MKSMSRKTRIAELKRLIAEWDKLAKDNYNNKCNLSTSERQDWVDELMELTSE